MNMAAKALRTWSEHKCRPSMLASLSGPAHRLVASGYGSAVNPFEYDRWHARPQFEALVPLGRLWRPAYCQSQSAMNVCARRVWFLCRAGCEQYCRVRVSCGGLADGAGSKVVDVLLTIPERLACRFEYRWTFS